MAEFTEVCRQARRLCEAHGNGVDNCDKCPMADKFGYAYGCSIIHMSNECSDAEYIEFEDIVMKWATEHPEPTYPTWRYAWKQLFPESSHNRPPCPRYFMSEERVDGICPGRNCADCWELPIPADIAEKLGIKPIGVE